MWATRLSYKKNCYISLDNWENIVADCYAWCCHASICKANMVLTRIEVATLRCAICMAKAVFPLSHTSNQHSPALTAPNVLVLWLAYSATLEGTLQWSSLTTKDKQHNIIIHETYKLNMDSKNEKKLKNWLKEILTISAFSILILRCQLLRM